jgi:hypothetical protein
MVGRAAVQRHSVKMASRTLAQSSDFSISYPPGFVASVVKPDLLPGNAPV